MLHKPFGSPLIDEKLNLKVLHTVIVSFFDVVDVFFAEPAGCFVLSSLLQLFVIQLIVKTLKLSNKK